MPDAEPEVASRLTAEDNLAVAMLRRVWLAFEAVAPLQSVITSPAGRLTLLCGAGENPTCRAAGSRIAGGATLVVVADRRASRALMREGACDFLVSSLDEALRILKNEVRKGTPLSVCLAADPVAVLAECCDRGVQPDQIDQVDAILQQRGARVVLWPSALRPGLHWVTFVLEPGGNAAALNHARICMREALPPADIRRLWLQNAPAVLGRRLQRYSACPMDNDEIQGLLELLRQDDPQRIEGLVLLQESAQIWPVVR